MKIKIFSIQYLLICIFTFLILFLMNYLGNPSADKTYRALLTATAGVLGLTIGIWVMNFFNTNDSPPEKFD